MINKEKKEKIIKFYLEAKSITKVMHKYNISKPTVYRIIEEFSLPKISEIREKERNEKKNIQSIIDYYMSSSESDQEKTIRELANQYEVSLSYILNLLKKYHIPIPKTVTTGLRPIEFFPPDDNINISYIENKGGIDINSDLYEPISIISKFRELGWDKRDGIHRLLNLAHYIKVKNGIDVFETFSHYLEQVIKNQETAELKHDLETIERGETLNVGNIENRINYTLLKQVEEMVFDLSEPEPQPQSELETRQPFFNNDFIETFLAWSNPIYYRLLMIMKGKKDPLSLFYNQNQIAKILKREN